jgi:hypothetical protein
MKEIQSMEKTSYNTVLQIIIYTVLLILLVVMITKSNINDVSGESKVQIENLSSDEDNYSNK